MFEVVVDTKLAVVLMVCVLLVVYRQERERGCVCVFVCGDVKQKRREPISTPLLCNVSPVPSLTTFHHLRHFSKIKHWRLDEIIEKYPPAGYQRDVAWAEKRKARKEAQRRQQEKEGQETVAASANDSLEKNSKM